MFINSQTAVDAFGPHVKMAKLANGDLVVIDADPGHVNQQTQAMVDELLTYINVDRSDVTHVMRPTVVLRCDADGLPVDGDMTPLRTFPPGTSHEDALAQLEE